MKRTISIETLNQVGETVKLNGWVHVRRDMGKISFIDLPDRWGILQVVLVPAELDEESNAIIKDIRPEFVLEIEGVDDDACIIFPDFSMAEMEDFLKVVYLQTSQNSDSFARILR